MLSYQKLNYLIWFNQEDHLIIRFLGRLLKTGLPLTKNVIKPLNKSVLIPLGLNTAASAAYAGILKKLLDSETTN